MDDLQPREGPAVALSATSVEINQLVTNFAYMPTIEAANMLGSVKVDCPSVELTAGENDAGGGGGGGTRLAQ
jgi:hypothetical protein